MILVAEGISDRGIMRKNNEDKVLMDGEIFYNDHLILNRDTAKLGCYAVADGMGGHNAGEVASMLALESLQLLVSELKNLPVFDNFKVLMDNWIENTNNSINQLGMKKPAYSGMGTTLAAACFQHDKIFLFHAGDTRIYHKSNGLLIRNTRDHTLSEMMEDDELPSNLLTNVMGGGANTYIEAEDLTGKIQKDDHLLICSDGLTDMVDDMVIEELIDQENGTKKLVEKAIENGGRDNISIINIRFTEI